MIKEEDLKSNTFGGGAGWIAYLDAKARSDKDLAERPDLFTAAHMQKVEHIEKIVREFFSKSSKFYITHRAGTKKAFSVVKVDDVIFPNWLPQKEKDDFKTILDLAGVDVIRDHKNTSAISYKIFC